MKLFFCVLFLSFFVADVAYSEQKKKEEKKKQEITVTKEECQKIASYTPAQNVDYVPGKDVYGNDVVSADLNSGYGMDSVKQILPKNYSTQIKMNLAGKYGIPDSFSADGFSVGKVDFKDGQVYFNEHPLLDEDRVKIEQACKKMLFSEKD